MFVAFTGASGLFDNAFNKFACLATGKRDGYCHVEVGCHTDLGHLRELSERLSGREVVRDRVALRTQKTLNDLLDAYPLSASNDEQVCLAFHAFYGQPLGVRVLSLHCPDPLYQPYDANWTVWRFPGAKESTVRAQTAWCLSKVGLPYDSWGALCSPLRSFHKEASVVEPDPETWWCSAHALRFLQNVGFLTDTYSLRGCTPNNLGAALETYKGSAKASSEASTAIGERTVSVDDEHWSVVDNVVHNVLPGVLRVARSNRANRRGRFRSLRKSD